MELFPPDIVETLHSSKLIVNATSVGMFPDADDTFTDLEESFSNEQIVFDLIYNPPETKLMRIAKKNGGVVMGGLNMLVSQAAKSFALWTGEEMPVDEISKSLQLYISK
jgi:shikimate dehydrogenase